MAASAAFRIASVTLKTASSTALFWDHCAGDNANRVNLSPVCAMKMISGDEKRVPAPLTCETREREMIAAKLCRSFATPRKFNIGSRVGEQMARSRSERPRGCMENMRFLVVVQLQTETVTVKSTARSVARENL
ncbi:hypothetical protein TNCV_4689541 [Trichonephila clavipes]|nr:hypothetical protein TNCV_4689541 [Trichonephila clavipes]